MSKKKRNKPYKGSVAATRPIITRVSAVNRHPVHQWWVDHQRVAKPLSIAAGIALAVIIILIGLIDIIW